MSAICNKEKSTGGGTTSVYERVDAPVATGSAHFMRAGAELHLIHAALELRDTRAAALHLAVARAGLAAAVESYDTSHRIAEELDFYAIHDERLRAAGTGPAGVLGVIGDAERAGLIDLDGPAAAELDRTYRVGGDRAAFTGFISDLRAFEASLAEFDAASAEEDLVAWQRFAWAALTRFDRIRVCGQAIAIVNILGLSPVTAR